MTGIEGQYLQYRQALPIRVLTLIVFVSGPLGGQSSNTPILSPESPYRGVLGRYCVNCHNAKSQAAGLALDRVQNESAAQSAETWEKVIKKLRAAEMPPRGMPRPDSGTYEAFRMALEGTIDRAAAQNVNPGPAPIHRLNRTEYVAAIRDLLAIDVDGAALLPADDSSHGFDNIAQVLSITPMVMERYLSAAAHISRMAVGEPDLQPSVTTYALDESLKQTDRMSEDLPFGTRGGLAIRHLFPADGEYRFTVYLQKNTTQLAFVEFSQRGKLIGLSEPHQLSVLLDGNRIKKFTVGGEQEASDKASVETGLEVRVAVKAGPRVVGVTFADTPAAPEGVLRLLRPDNPLSSALDGGPGIESFAIIGPYGAIQLGETPSRVRIFTCRPAGRQDEPACAERLLTRLAHRAYRRPCTDREIRTLLSFYEAGRREGGFEAGIEAALERILVSPQFLFRVEPDPPDVKTGTVYRLGDIELASRLSFFLWSSIPDEALLDLAERGKLHDPVVLEQQVRRMLQDERAKALVTNFASQWLELRKLQNVTPDKDAFPDFDENLRDALLTESELFVESIIREDRSALDLLNANYTFLNERLARHYSIPDVYGSRYRRVIFDMPERRGLLGKGSVLTATSYANRTSPVLRGKWILENILGSPPPPPPANVPSLKEDNNTKILTMRQRMEAHRANPACAGCHTRMDPLGFALENYDGVGRWRTSTDGHTPIDASGQLPDGTKIQNPGELSEFLSGHSGQFVNTVSEKLLTYALGREVEYYDAPAIRKIVHDAAVADYRWSSIILGVVNSTPFQMRRSSKP